MFQQEVDVFAIREAFNALGREVFINEMSKAMSHEDKSNRVNLLLNNNVQLKFLAEAIGYDAFSILIGNQAEYILKSAYRDTDAPLERLFYKMPSSQDTE